MARADPLSTTSIVCPLLAFDMWHLHTLYVASWASIHSLLDELWRQLQLDRHVLLYLLSAPLASPLTLYLDRLRITIKSTK